jgi:hypothetical protein
MNATTFTTEIAEFTEPLPGRSLWTLWTLWLTDNLKFEI